MDWQSDPPQRFLDEAEASQVFPRLLDTVPDGFLAVDTAGIVLGANSRFSELTGYDPDTLIGLHITDIDATHDSGQALQRIEAISAAGGHLLFETVLRSATGAEIPVEVAANSSPIRGGIVFALVRDISERLERERALDSERNC